MVAPKYVSAVWRPPKKGFQPKQVKPRQNATTASSAPILTKISRANHIATIPSAMAAKMPVKINKSRELAAKTIEYPCPPLAAPFEVFWRKQFTNSEEIVGVMRSSVNESAGCASVH